MENDAIHDLFSVFGPVRIRRMFGGKGVYCDGCIIAVEIRGELMLKADSESAPDFAAAGARQWGYAHARSGRPVLMPYWTVPDHAADDPSAFSEWANKALAAARRAERR